MMRNFAKPGTAKAAAGEWDGAAWDRLMACWVREGVPGEFNAPGGGALARPDVLAASSGFPAVIDLAALDGTIGVRFDGVDSFDYSGTSVSSAGDVNGDGFDDVIIGAVFAAPGGTYNAGASYVVFGRAEGFPASLDLAALDGRTGFRLDGIDALDRSGASVSSAGDVNGDGFDDIIIGAPEAEGGDYNAGESYVVFGKAGGFAPIFDLATLDGGNGFRLAGIDFDDRSGESVASAGDVNGDGFDDIIIEAPFAHGAGETYVVFGGSGAFSASVDLSTLDGTNGFTLAGIDEDDFSGRSVSSAGDVNGDGFDDIIIGAPYADQGPPSYSGEAYIVFGKAEGFEARLDLGDLDGTNGFRLEAIGERDYGGRSVSSAGDVNGDGFDDIIIGAPGRLFFSPGAGDSYVVFGKAGGFAASIDLAALDGTNGFRIDPIDPKDGLGFAVSSAGDINGDGFDDMLLGAFRGDPDGITGAGESYVVFGKAGGFDASIDLASLDGSNGFRLDGVGRDDNSGDAVSAAGDVNGDGFDDIMIGARYADAGGDDRAGQSYVVFGRAPDEAVRRVGSIADQTIRGGDFGDTLLGKRGDDVLAGGGGKDKLTGGKGADHFEFASLDAADADRITDFVSGTDEIALDGDVFGLPEGALAARRFVTGTAAGDANDRLIYDGATGKLFFDADGTGAQGQVLIATLTGAPVIAAGDFLVI